MDVTDPKRPIKMVNPWASVTALGLVLAWLAFVLWLVLR